MQLEKITDSNFTNVADAWFEKYQDGLIILKFEASWCGPCKVMTKSLADLSDDYFDNDVKICSVDIDSADDLSRIFNIRSVPTMVFLSKFQYEKILDENPSTLTMEIAYVFGSVPMEDIKKVIKEVKDNLWKQTS